MKYLFTALVAIAVLTACDEPPPPPESIDDLPGLSVRDGEAGLEALGYRFITARRVGDHIQAIWWHGENQKCLDVTTVDKRYDHIAEIHGSACDPAIPYVYPHPHDFRDLAGKPADMVEPRLEGSGFKVVDSLEGDGVLSRWWFSPKTAECVKISESRERVSEVVRAPGYPLCKVRK